ncbi:hypothetical protein PC9H_006815 [Pleurotus ostreatus]|uniref:Uncharacterized protein n=1 Tax=Pleurotus ostreatus TaxID=5322 RepID=A0A8H7A1L8_PLEOS|nr:uncharacterized protein PC9H_006815 [Pleurotus ostreatus]KAF7431096.1 hypothetical protein PC9H_006815 [Pleurotus ostreatus]KAJ8695498.1 hypothetical protein PTI98_008100 [Pleurotus ostreatus]
MLTTRRQMRLVNLHRAKREQAGVNTAAAPFGPQPGQRAGNRNGTSPGEEVPHFDQALERQTPVSGAGMTNGLLPPSTPNNNSMTAPSSFSMLSMNGGGAAMSTDLFSMDFINSVANTLEDFDTSIFRPDGDITFERDFQRWFNGDDAMDGGLL